MLFLQAPVNILNFFFLCLYVYAWIIVWIIVWLPQSLLICFGHDRDDLEQHELKSYSWIMWSFWDQTWPHDYLRTPPQGSTAILDHLKVDMKSSAHTQMRSGGKYSLVRCRDVVCIECCLVTGPASGWLSLLAGLSQITAGWDGTWHSCGKELVPTTVLQLRLWWFDCW